VAEGVLIVNFPVEINGTSSRYYLNFLLSTERMSSCNDFQRGRLTSILDFQSNKWGIYPVYNASGSDRIHVCPELFFAVILHGFYAADGGVRTLPSGSGRSSNVSGLPPHAESLATHGGQCCAQQPCLKTAYYDQKAAKYPKGVVGPIFRYRHGRKFSDSHGLMCIVGPVGIAAVLIVLGCVLIDASLARRGFLITGAACFWTCLPVCAVPLVIFGGVWGDEACPTKSSINRSMRIELPAMNCRHLQDVF
jgi:hypothetical protein